MIVRQILHSDPVALSYLFGCGGQALGAVVDPVAEPSHYLKIAQDMGLHLRYVIDSHVHADHLSTGRDLASLAGADYVLFADADVAPGFQGVGQGDVLELGNVIATVLHTPGHTPDHISLLVTDRTRSAEPWFVLTGHTLMVGDVGRTELATDAADGARILFKSLRRLKELADYIEVLPGAYSGSVCGRRLSGKPTSTIGFERHHNVAFRIDNEADFIRAMLDDVPPIPAGAAAFRARNAGKMALPRVGY